MTQVRSPTERRLRREPEQRPTHPSCSHPAQINSIRTHLHSFRSTISLLSELHTLHLNASTDTLQAQLSAKIAAARSEATALANRVRMEITALNARNKQDGLGREAFEVRKVQLQSVHRTFQGVLVEFNSMERDARERYRERAEKQYRIGESCPFDHSFGRA